MSCHPKELDAVCKSHNLNRRYTAPMVKKDEDDMSENPEMVPGEVDSIFSSEIMPICWYSLNTLLFEGKGGGKFKPPTGYEHIMSSYLEGLLPAIGVKKEYIDSCEIAWCKNVMNEMVEECVTKVDDYIDLQKFDNHWLNIEPNYFMKLGFDDEYNIGQGNTPELQEYSKALPMHNIRADQPFFYSYSSCNAFPLFLLNSQSIFTHNYTFRSNISSLLRMRISQGEEWINVAPDLNKLIGVPVSGSLDEPKLYGKFAKIRNNEKKWNECERTEYIYYTNDVAICDDVNDEQCTRSVTIALKDTAPTTAIFWTAHNITAEEVNIRALYGKISDGTTPIYTSGLKVGDSDKFKLRQNHHFTGVNLKEHFKRAHDPRFLCYPISDKPGTSNITVSCPLSKLGSSLTIKLDDNETMKWLSGKTDVRVKKDHKPPCTERFKIRCRLLMQHELFIDKNGSVSFRDE